MIVLFIFFMTSVSIISNEFSNLLISRISVKTYYEPIDCLKDLIQSEIPLMSQIQLKNELLGKNSQLEILVNKAIKNESWIEDPDYFKSNKWLVEMSKGKNALFIREKSIRYFLIVYKLVPNFRFKTIRDYSSKSLNSFIYRKGLDKNFRRKLNYW